MTRTVTLFNDATALVDGIDADALGGNADLPFLSDNARVAAAKAALAVDDWDAAEAISARGVVSPSDGDVVQVTFVQPPDWQRFGAALWPSVGGAAHAVFHSSVMLVDGVAQTDCVGLPFQDDAARRDCAAWCLRNGLDDLAINVSRTPVGGEGPHCTWPDADLDDLNLDHVQPRRAETHTAASVAIEEPGGLQEQTVDASARSARAPEHETENVKTDLFGVTVCPLDL